ncbi:MAG: hypothetical protein WKF78_06345 [Candidatus Limnocylindrales bacterium]
MRDVERLRSSLSLTAEETAAIAGLGARRYYELVGGTPFGRRDLAEISNRGFDHQCPGARATGRHAVTVVRSRADESDRDCSTVLDFANFKTSSRARSKSECPC